MTAPINSGMRGRGVVNKGVESLNNNLAGAFLQGAQIQKNATDYYRKHGFVLPFERYLSDIARDL